MSVFLSACAYEDLLNVIICGCAITLHQTWVDSLVNYLLIVQAGPNDNLKDVALKILQNEVATVPILYSSSDDGSFPQLLHIASLSGILKCKPFC